MKFSKYILREISRILAHYGADNQKKKVQEELQELSEAISEDNRTHVIEELTDVYIVLEQLKQIYRVSEEEMETVADFKISRQKTRIQKETITI